MADAQMQQLAQPPQAGFTAAHQSEQPLTIDAGKSIAAKVQTRYADATYTSRYLEAEWGDFLLDHAAFPEGRGAPFGFDDRNVTFYKEVVEMLRENFAELVDAKPGRVADVGCASGRLVVELCEAFPSIEKVLGFEPSANLCALARCMVLGEAFPESLGVSHLPLGGQLPIEVPTALSKALQRHTARHKAQFVQATAEVATLGSGQFNLVCCLNVLDRHPNPPALVESLRSLTSLGGLLCISSPLEWQANTTPEVHWRDNVRDFLSDSCWQILDRRDIGYCFRVNCRRVVQYASDVVLAQRKE